MVSYFFPSLQNTNYQHFFRYTVTFKQHEWEVWDYEFYWGYTFENGHDTEITVTGQDVNFRYHNTIGDYNTFQFHKDVTFYGAIPSNTFKPANVKIDNFSITKLPHSIGICGSACGRRVLNMIHTV